MHYYAVNNSEVSAPVDQCSGVASPQILGVAINFGGQNVWFQANNTILLRKTPLKAKMTIFSKNWREHGPFGPPGYAYGSVAPKRAKPRRR